MSISISKAGPYFSSGSISFSSLRNTFKLTSSGSISASELRRDTNANSTNPIVPDATENASISSGSNLRISQFRNSIKYYDITQSGTDGDISLQSSSYWNGNTGKNIVKTIYVKGTNGGITRLYSAAIRYRGDLVATRNMTIRVSGKVYGAYGDGSAGYDGLNGGDGGSAFRVEGSGSGNRRINFIVESGAKIWAGGGGGEKGKDGKKGIDGTCRESIRTQGCGESPACPSGFSRTGSWTGNCCESYTYCCGLFNCGCEACSKYLSGNICSRDYTISGGEGGQGGAGGRGRGWDNFSGSIRGSAGGAGQEPPGDCGGNALVAYATKGEDGGKGGDGGEWGKSGENTDNVGSGGKPGFAIFGKNFDLSGRVNSSTVKGRIEYNFVGIRR